MPNDEAASGRDRKAEAGGEARELEAKAREKGDELKARAREEGEELKARVRESAEGGKDEVADRIGSVSRALERAADGLDEEGDGWMSGYVRDAAQRVERLRGYLADRDVGAVLGDLEDAARSNPGTFLGGSFAAGVALGRFLRSTERAGGADRGPAQSAADSSERSRGVSSRSARWSTPASSRMGEPERPGVRTGGAAMASEAAGSGRDTAEDAARADEPPGSRAGSEGTAVQGDRPVEGGAA